MNDFIAEKYPGTDSSYSSFASEVTVVDDETFDYRIYMNNILNYEGYRFFQASFDTDEQGTILSVNHDFWGTLFTYIGYILLYFGLDKSKSFVCSPKKNFLSGDRPVGLVVILIFIQICSLPKKGAKKWVGSCTPCTPGSTVPAQSFGLI